MMRSNLARLAPALAAAALLLAPHALAQQTTRIVVGGPPGGVFDNVYRLIADRLDPALGGPAIIDNRPGAGGTVAMEVLKAAKPDGTTLGMINLSAAANESIVKGKTYNLLTDVELVGLYAFPANVLIVNPSVPATSVPALVEVLKKSGTMNYSSGGVGSPGHLAGEMFKARTGVPMTHVPYKGAPPAVLAVVAGETSLMFATASAAMGQVRADKVRALAVTTAERVRQLPDTPTMVEAGLADFNVSDWIGFVVPKGTPPETRDRLHRILAAAFADPVVQDRLRNATFIPASPPLGPAEFAAFLKAEVDKWAKVVREAKITQD